MIAAVLQRAHDGRVKVDDILHHQDPQVLGREGRHQRAAVPTLTSGRVVPPLASPGVFLTRRRQGRIQGGKLP
jgi:hypothetical protein